MKLEERARFLNDRPAVPGPVIYWMSRDQRVADNWALLYAQKKAMEFRASLVVLFCLSPGFLGATLRQYGFMIRGFRQVSDRLLKKRIGFFLRKGDPVEEVERFVHESGASFIVTDFDPLRIKRHWKDVLAEKLKIPLVEVDAHNIVPCWIASEKKEYGAYTLRPKLHRHLPEWLTEIPRLRVHPHQYALPPESLEVDRLLRTLPVDRAVPEVDWISPGESAAAGAMRKFIREGLEKYDNPGREPGAGGHSGLSPWIHFGQLSAQRVALEVRKAGKAGMAEEAFLEQLIVRKELSDNFCFFEKRYDMVEGFPDWGVKTLSEHRKDRRPYLYSLNELEKAVTHDPFWNAAQREMMQTGKMHGHMRMYWAKKILEWSPSPEEAMEAAILLNDRYEMDGRDPNGYTGIAWSIGGVHDRAWGERPVFGKIRYMNERGLKKKFDMSSYLTRYGIGETATGES